MQDKKYSGVAVDTWALGVLLFLLLTGKYPFQPCPTRENMFKKICAGDFDVPGHVSQGARQVLAGLLQADPEKRMKLGAVRRSNCCKSRHTLHVTRHTSHVTRHTSLVRFCDAHGCKRNVERRKKVVVVVVLEVQEEEQTRVRWGVTEDLCWRRR